MPEEVVRIMCPNLMCRKVLAVPPSARGKTVRCRACATAIRIPASPGAKGAKPTDSKPAEPTKG